MDVDGLLFDKDGTLFGFAASWAQWTQDIIEELAAGDEGVAESLASALLFDRTTMTFDEASISIAGSVADQVDVLAPHLPDWTSSAMLAFLKEAAARAEMVPAVPLDPLLGDLAGRGLRLGVATNDAEAAARAQLERHGVLNHFHYLAGFDSGFGAKPGPGMCRAFAEQHGLDPGAVAMVGDSLHDLHAGRAAGMICIGVPTGAVGRDTLAPAADVVLDDIGQLPAWLETQR